MNERSKQDDKTSSEQNHRVDQLGSQIAALFRRSGLHQDIPEMRGYVVKPCEFHDEIEAQTDVKP
jgi:hypothetical protein